MRPCLHGQYSHIGVTHIYLPSPLQYEYLGSRTYIVSVPVRNSEWDFFQVLSYHLLNNEWQLSTCHLVPTVVKDIHYLIKVKQQSKGYKSTLNKMRHFVQ